MVVVVVVLVVWPGQVWGRMYRVLADDGCVVVKVKVTVKTGVVVGVTARVVTVVVAVVTISSYHWGHAHALASHGKQRSRKSRFSDLVLFLTSISCHDRQNPTNHHVTTKQWTSSCEPLETQATATTTGKDHACVGSQLLPLRVQIMNAVNDDSRV